MAHSTFNGIQHSTAHSTIATIIVALLVATSSIRAEEQCVNYVDYMKPLLQSGDVQRLQKAFQVINSPANSGTSNNLLLPIDKTVVSDKHNIKMLISLSKPYLSLMNTSDLWPVNSRPLERDDINPLNTYHGGVRFIYSCVLHQERSCLRNVCKYNPNTSMGKSSSGYGSCKEMFITIDNFIAADGSDISAYITEGEDVYVIRGFRKITVVECFARQLFVKFSEDNCFDKTKFFSLPEKVENSRGQSGQMNDVERTSFFAVMSN